MDNLEDILKNLNINSGGRSTADDSAARDQIFRSIDSALQTNETTSKWIREMENVSQEELNVAMTVCKNEVDDFIKRTAGEDAEDMRYSAIETVAKRLIQAEIYVQQKDYESGLNNAKDVLRLIKDFYDKGYFNKEYMAGFRYVADCLTINAKVKNILKKGESKQVDMGRLRQLLEQVEQFKKLGRMQEVGVLAIKQYFIGNLRKSDYDLQTKIISKIVQMDPENLEWRSCLYSIYKFNRKSGENSMRPSPSRHEIDAITEAMSMSSAKFDPRIPLGYAFCLAELLKASWKPWTPIRFGSKTFYTAIETLECIRAKVDDVLAIDPTSVRANIDIAKIYSSILPYPYRNASFAMACINRALLFHPTSSKANHRMGIFKISISSPSAALEYLEKAVENDERNVFAVLDLLKVYMANVSANRSKIDKIFSQAQNHPFYKAEPVRYAEILLLKALYKFLDGKNDDCVSFMVEAFTKSAKCAKSIEMFKRDFNRFNWPNSDGYTTSLPSIIRSKLNAAYGPERDVLCKILEAFGSRSGFDGGYGRRRDNSYSGHNRSQGGFNRGFHGSAGGGFNSGQRGDGNIPRPAAPVQDNYAILGVSRTASLAEIKKQYYKLALENHPDKFMHLTEKERLEKQESMKKINNAYDKLSSI